MKKVNASFDETLKKHVTILDGQLINFHASKEEAEDAAIRYTTQFNCEKCSGTGRIFWHGSEYSCAH